MPMSESVFSPKVQLLSAPTPIIHTAEKNSAPIMPMDPANAVKIVRPFLVIRLLRDREKAVRADIEARFSLPVVWGCSVWPS